MSGSEIINFFADQNIFLTGGTGFLGKVLVYKLLKTCKVKKLYLLVRPKKGKTTEERFEEYFNNQCFKHLKEQNVVIGGTTVFITGDCEKPNMGISKETEEMLIKNTNIVFHAAANVRFDLPLRLAANINVRGSIDMLNLAKKMPYLKSFIYVSTAFSNCPHQTIEEKSYSPPLTPEQLFSLLDGIPDDAILSDITSQLLQEWPNTYTFTKSIAEDYLYREGKGLPVAICRPTIVVSAAEEPTPGWIDNLYGPVGLVAARGIGILRCWYGKKDYSASIVPCDFVVNNIIAASWDVANNKSKEVMFYNTPTRDEDPITWGRYITLCEVHYADVPLSKAIGFYKCFKKSENLVVHKIFVFFLHTLFAYVVDFVLKCTGRRPIAVKMYDKVHNSLTLLSYFTTRNWVFISSNSDNLWKKMSSEDKKLFNFNFADTDFTSYMKDHVIGIRLYLFNDPLETVPEGKKRLKILAAAFYGVGVLVLFLLYILFKFIINLF